MEPITPQASLPQPAARPAKRWVTVALAFLVFLSGAVIGAAGAVAYVVHQVRVAIHHPQQMPQRLASRLTKRLDLTPMQETQVRDVLTTRQSRLLEIRRQVQPRVEAELQGVHDDVSALLDSRQASKWNELYNEFRANWIPNPPSATTTPASIRPDP